MKGSVFSSRASSPHHQTPSPPPRAHHTFSENIMDENIDYAETVIRRWDIDTQKSSTLFVDDDRREAKRFIEAVTGLQQAMHYYSKIRSSSDVLVRAQNLMQIAVKRLEKEFYVILSANRKNLDSESVSSRSSRASARTSISDFNEDEVSEEEETSTTPSRTASPRGGNSISAADRALDTAMADLKMIADCMISNGYAKECVHIYKLIRKSIIDETLYYLGVEKLNYSQMQKMDWNVLEPKIKIWLHAVKVAVKTLFSGERILCDEVFSSSEKIAESCFTDISKDAAVNLFFFPENFGKSKKILAPEKMFRALDQFEAISDLWPEIESVFSHDSLSPVRFAAEEALVKLGEAVRTMLVQFEAAIQKDSSKTSIGGSVHPLTRYVMNYLIFLGDYCGSIAVIVTDWSVGSQSPLPESYFASPIAGEDPMAADLSARLAWLILVLLCKLDGKAVMYNDVALAYLFLANNLNYVVSKIRNSSLGPVMGFDWISDTQSKVDKYFGNYERMGWSNVLSSLPEDPTADISPQDSMECFRRFNLNFEEAYKKQTSWVIPDPKRRDDIKISLARKIVPNYREFYQKHRANFARRMGVESIVRYAPEDLNNYLSDLFFAGGGTSSHLTYPESPMSTRGR